MAGGQERVLRRRIRSVQSTKKITKAMELIAASRIVKAQQRVAAARPYAEAITNVLANLAGASSASSSPLLAAHEEIRVVGYVLIGGDRGLCGGYNANIIRAGEAAIRRTLAEGKDYYLVCVGKKIEAYFKFRHYKIAATLHGTADRPSYDAAKAVAGMVMPPYEANEIDQVELIYTQFLSVGSQKIVERRFLPLDTEAITAPGPAARIAAAAPAPGTAAAAPGTAAHGAAGGSGGPAAAGGSGGPAAAGGSGGSAADYEYEPSAEYLLDRLLPRYVEAKLFSAMLDGSASVFAAQQRAMAAASENADELITKLTRLRNRARQDSITTEIMEIVGGAEAQSQKQPSAVL